jgi:hypothetical protein
LALGRSAELVFPLKSLEPRILCPLALRADEEIDRDTCTDAMLETATRHDRAASTLLLRLGTSIAIGFTDSANATRKGCSTPLHRRVDRTADQLGQLRVATAADRRRRAGQLTLTLLGMEFLAVGG